MLIEWQTPELPDESSRIVSRTGRVAISVCERFAGSTGTPFLRTLALTMASAELLSSRCGMQTSSNLLEDY
jgi:hypothetical protein